MKTTVGFFKKNALVLITLVWISLIAMGFTSLLKYSNNPGEVGKTPSAWPIGSSVAQNTTGPTLIVFSHPKCPCTRATASELERLLTQVDGMPLVTYVLLYSPAEVSDDWSKTDLREKFEAIPHVHVLNDKGGVEAEKFGALTSGQALLYSTDGRLLFRGGITAHRGAEGDNIGRDALVSLIANREATRNETHVFGCSISKTASIGWKVE